MQKTWIPLMAFAVVTACSQNGERSDFAVEDVEGQFSPASDETLTSIGWGPLRIGMTRDEVTAAVGGKADPDAMGGPEPELCEEYQPEQTPDGLFVMIEEGILVRITLGEGATTQTADGISVDGSADDVRTVYGDRVRSTPHTYVSPPGEYLTVWTNGDVSDRGTSDPEAHGIRYEIDADRMVRLIHAGGPAIQYVEGCL